MKVVVVVVVLMKNRRFDPTSLACLPTRTVFQEPREMHPVHA